MNNYAAYHISVVDKAIVNMLCGLIIVSVCLQKVSRQKHVNHSFFGGQA